MAGWRKAGAMLFVAALLASQPASAHVPAGFFGINPGDLFLLPQSQWDGQLAAMRDGGVDAVRMPTYWSELEPSPSSPRWEEIDDQVAALARHGLRWEPLLCFTPTWDQSIPGDYASAPAEPGYLAAFAAALARRYGPGGAFWAAHRDLAPLPVRAYELWNEPNAATYFEPHSDAPQRYADLYAAVRGAVREVDGSARVAVGGLASPGAGVIPAAAFVARMLDHRPDLRGDLDAVGFHPYSPQVRRVYAQIAAFRHRLDRIAGPGVPIDINEVGWTTTETPEAVRAADLAALAGALPSSDCGIGRLMPYAWIGPEQDPRDRLQWFGLADRNGGMKPSGAAYLRAAQLADTEPRRVVCQPRMRLSAVARTAGGRAHLEVASTCAAPCALSLRVTQRGRGRTLARRVLRFQRGARYVRLALPRSAPPGAPLAVRARAWTGTGWRATRVRTVDMPRS